MSAQAAPLPPLTVAVIGCGKMGINHIKAILACPAARLVGISDPVADLATLPVQLPEAVGRFTSPAAMLETARPDVVHIVTPPQRRGRSSRRHGAPAGRSAPVTSCSSKHRH